MAAKFPGMDENPIPPPHTAPPVPPEQLTFWQRVKKALTPVGVVILVAFKFLLPVVKTGGTMIIAVGVYALRWGWQFALGFVRLITSAQRWIMATLHFGLIAVLVLGRQTALIPRESLPEAHLTIQ